MQIGDCFVHFHPTDSTLVMTYIVTGVGDDVVHLQPVSDGSTVPLLIKVLEQGGYDCWRKVTLEEQFDALDTKIESVGKSIEKLMVLRQALYKAYISAGFQHTFKPDLEPNDTKTE